MSQFLEKKWWNAPEGDAHHELFAYVRSIKEQQSGVFESMRYWASLYHGYEVMGLTPGTFKSLDPLFGTVSGSDPALTYNVIRSCVDTVVAQMSISRVRPMFLTSGGDWAMRRQAKQLGKYVEGIYHAEDYYGKETDVRRNGALYGTGHMYFYEDSKDVRMESVHPIEVIVDEQSAIDGKTKMIQREKFIPKDALVGMYPDKEEQIENERPLHVDGGVTITDLVCVVEAWRQPSGKEGDKGRHLICVEGATLLDEEWNKDFLPFVKYVWTKKVRGYYGEGLACEQHGKQRALNNLLARVQKSLEVNSWAWLMKHKNSKIQNNKITNDLLAIIDYEGTQPPDVRINQVIPPEVFQHIQQIKKDAYEEEGISQMSATSQRPPGFPEYGVAIRMMRNIESARFADKQAAIERFNVECADLLVKMGKEVYPSSKTVLFPSKDSAVAIKWSDVDLPRDKFFLKAMPINALPDDPAGKTAMVENWVNLGMIPPDKAFSLMGFPDTERYQSVEDAIKEDIENSIEAILADGIYIAPEPYQDLNLAVKLGQHYMSLSRVEGVDEKHRALLSMYIDEAQGLLEQSQPPPAPPAPPGAPQGAEPAPQQQPLPVGDPGQGQGQQ
jgi:hypothetical protein